jgi:hypothetical protein
MSALRSTLSAIASASRSTASEGSLSRSPRAAQAAHVPHPQPALRSRAGARDASDTGRTKSGSPFRFIVLATALRRGLAVSAGSVRKADECC